MKFLICLVLFVISSQAQFCDNEGSKRCLSCAQTASCIDGLLQPEKSCDLSKFQSCSEINSNGRGRGAICSVGTQTECVCPDSESCLDDPYSLGSYIDCAAPLQDRYKSCSDDLVHDGNCGCIQYYFREITLGREACSQSCDYNVTTGGPDPNCDGGFFHCSDPADPPTINECPTELPCFDVEKCQCATIDNLPASCNESCALEYEGGTCPRYYFCDDQGDPIGDPQICPQGFCYVQAECKCVYQTPPPTTTSTTTIYPCDETCLLAIIPDGAGPGCDAVADCDSQLNVITCPNAECYDATICGCSGASASPTVTDSTTTGSTGTGSTGSGSTGTGSTGTGSTGTGSTGTGSTGTGSTNSSPTTTTSSPSGCIPGCDFTTHGTDDCMYVECTTGDSFTCPHDKCYFDLATCDCIEPPTITGTTTLAACNPGCDFTNHPTDNCLYVECATEDTFTCPHDKCYFDLASCDCIPPP